MQQETGSTGIKILSKKEADEGAKNSKELEKLFEARKKIKAELEQIKTEPKGVADEHKIRQLIDDFNREEEILRSLPFMRIIGLEKDFSTEVAKKEFADLKETLQRVQAEFENSRKRLEKEKLDFALVANFHIMKEMLPVLDSIDAAEQSIAKHESISRQDALKGIELIKKQLLAILSSHGLREIKCNGQRFDPMLHECVMQGCEKGKQDNFVLLELQKGYLLNGRVLRHAKVKVNKQSDEK